MQTVGAQWLMLSLSGSAAYLAFIQSAASLPVLLFAIPAGAIGRPGRPAEAAAVVAPRS